LDRPARGGGGSDQIEDGTLILWLLHMDGYHELVVRGRGRGITARLREGARAAREGEGTRGRGHRGGGRERGQGIATTKEGDTRDEGEDRGGAGKAGANLVWTLTLLS
jgi:hypothetical protein